MSRFLSRRDFNRGLIAAGLAPLATANDDTPAMVLVEAESFDHPGGWVVDQQSTAPMGSSYLLAHGFGRPVANATTTVTLPAPGRYFVFVRTRDWTGPWKTDQTPASLKAEGSPGLFQVLIDGKPLATTFGEEGAEWHWQSGGAVEFASKTATLALHDLTGFDGRCESIVFAKSESLKPPNSTGDLRAWRAELLGFPSEPDEAGAFDLVVAGGGIAGICASVAAARSGLSVALIQDRPVLGGNSSSEIRVSPNSVRNVPPYPALGNVVKEFDMGMSQKVTPEQAETFQMVDRLKMLLVQSEPKITLFLNHHVCGAQMNGTTIESVDAADTRTGRRSRFHAKLFADCTGDAGLGYLAGADFRLGREARSETGESRAVERADDQVLGSTLHWYTGYKGERTSFPDCPWALKFTEESCLHTDRGAWNWETGYLLNQASQAELTRDHMLRAIYGNWAFQKNQSLRSERYANLELEWVGYVLGKRESRRLLGDVIYSEHDLTKATEYPDACVACDWGIDIHVPNPANEKHFPGWPFMAVHEHYDKGKAPMRWLPYRSLYSRNVTNLFMAGRNVSCTHVAFAWFRNQRTTGMMGEVVGLAAGLCLEQSTTPRDLYDSHFETLRAALHKGVPRRG
jgi:FAD-dependent oxidoreductase family protein